MSLTLILTHPGGSHKDELLACSLLAAVHRVPIVRREPTPEDLADPTIAVVDVGGEHAPERNNFDHHQFPADHPPVCALSLVLQHLGVYRYLATIGKATSVAALIYPDRRGSGYGLSRHNDNPLYDFTRIDQQPDVHFAHARGFVAKTSAAEIDRVKELLGLARV
jgi:hypothetical protein